MYSVDEVGSDYGVEDNLQGFELINDEVIVLQDRDPDDVMLGEVTHALEQAINALADVNRAHMLVKEAIVNGDHFARLYALSQSRETRQRYSDCVWMRPAPKTAYAIEMTVNQSSVVYALEEEEKDQKGFFRRIIDAILDMFSSLWKKITSLFGKDDTTTDDVKENKEKSLDTIKEVEQKVEEAKAEGKAIPDTVKLDKTRGVIESVIGEFGFLAKGGDKFTTNDIITYLDNYRDFFAVCNEAVTTIAEVTDLMSQTISRIESGGQGIDAKYITSMSTNVANAYARISSKMQSVTLDDDLKKHFDIKGDEKHVEIRAYGGLKLNGAMYICRIDHVDGSAIVKTKIYSKPRPEDKDGLILEHIGDFALQITIVNRIAELDEKRVEVSKKIAKVGENARHTNEKIKNNSEQLVKAFAETEDKEIPKKTVDFLKAVGSSLTGLTTSITYGLKYVKSATKHADMYNKFVMSKDNTDVVFEI